MSNARYRFHYVTGETEEIDSGREYNVDARQKLIMVVQDNKKWFMVDGKAINMNNVVTAEVIGEKEKMELDIKLTKPD
ncbi:MULTISPECIES: hypothetical protein [Bacillales]|uniref:hypothetical protein n=1 Tax=Bacillales TaxID=1385 RepID=UPI000373F543|nr:MULTISPECIES: hypothetical protein [Bacillales]KMZ42041.1 hypothetical protein AC624_13555 [Bacillus sp. FJAT-27238]